MAGIGRVLRLTAGVFFRLFLIWIVVFFEIFLLLEGNHSLLPDLWGFQKHTYIFFEKKKPLLILS